MYHVIIFSVLVQYKYINIKHVYIHMYFKRHITLIVIKNKQQYIVYKFYINQNHKILRQFL